MNHKVKTNTPTTKKAVEPSVRSIASKLPDNQDVRNLKRICSNVLNDLKKPDTITSDVVLEALLKAYAIGKGTSI